MFGYKHVLRQSFIKKGLNLFNRLDHFLQVKLNERCCITHGLSLSPISENFPEFECHIMDLLHLVVVLCAGKWVLLEFDWIVLVQKFEELLVESYFWSNLMNSFTALKELFKGFSAIVEPLFVFQIVFQVFLFKWFDLLRQRIAGAFHYGFHCFTVRFQVVFSGRFPSW